MHPGSTDACEQRVKTKRPFKEVRISTCLQSKRHFHLSSTHLILLLLLVLLLLLRFIFLLLYYILYTILLLLLIVYLLFRLIVYCLIFINIVML